MGTFDVDIGGATYRVDAPDENTAWQWANITHSQQKQSPRTPDAIEQSAMNFARDMPWYQQALAGTGKAFTDIGRGIGQRLGLVDQQTIDEARKRDIPLMQTGGGLTGNLTGNVVATLPTMAIPGANTLAGSAAIGAGLGAISPTATGESVASNAGLGAGLGAAGQALGAVAGRILRPVDKSLSAEEALLAARAQAEGIPLTSGQQTGSKPLQIIESVMENLPFTSSRQLATKKAQQEAFTRAALLRAGVDSGAATPEVLQARKSALGNTFEDIATRNRMRLFTPAEPQQTMYADWQSFSPAVPAKRETAGVMDSIVRGAPKEFQGRLDNVVNDIINSTDSTGHMSGKDYQSWREKLRLLAKDNDAEAHYFGQIRKALDESFSSQLSGNDLASWQNATAQYRNLKPIMQAMGGPGVQQTVGNLPPTQLAAALSNQITKERKALGYGDLNELTRAGRRFVTENLPDSHTAQRQFYTNLLTGQLAGAGAGGAIGYIEGKTPESALTGAAGGAAVALGGPRVIQALMNSDAGRKYLLHGAVNLTSQDRALVNGIIRGALMSSAIEHRNLTEAGAQQ